MKKESGASARSEKESLSYFWGAWAAGAPQEVEEGITLEIIIWGTAPEVVSTAVHVLFVELLSLLFLSEKQGKS
jgi:hypothetical protein